MRYPLLDGEERSRYDLTLGFNSGDVQLYPFPRMDVQAFFPKPALDFRL